MSPVAQDPGPLPEPEADARSHSERLCAVIADEIARAGAEIPFRRYMELALYSPGLGYYAAAGGAGLAGADFVTAPQISPLFARCLARQCGEVLDEMGGGDVLEPGAGTGALAAELLAALEAAGRLPNHYRIVELSAELQAHQRAEIERRVPHLLERCIWHGEWPEAFDGVVVANEVLDAFPVEGFRVSDAGLEQRRMRDEAGALADAWTPAPEELARAVAHIEADLGRALPSGYQSELSPQLAGWFAGLAASLRRGAALFVDYGYVRSEYYLPERATGTLVCTRAHRAHDDPYDWPGLTDITAFVDFTAVTEAATAAGFALEGFTPQAHFLFASGLEQIAAEARGEVDERGELYLAQQIKTLTMPGEMGERFNVIGFSKGLSAPLTGFARNDLSHRL
ncbi:MAG: SAM-dependent methyltransferase [Halofilum sp. (in: g-proteobacteria)]